MPKFCLTNFIFYEFNSVERGEMLSQNFSRIHSTEYNNFLA